MLSLDPRLDMWGRRTVRTLLCTPLDSTGKLQWFEIDV